MSADAQTRELRRDGPVFGPAYGIPIPDINPLWTIALTSTAAVSTKQASQNRDGLGSVGLL
jgi:hypothetical protein